MLVITRGYSWVDRPIMDPKSCQDLYATLYALDGVTEVRWVNLREIPKKYLKQKWIFINLGTFFL